MSETWDPIAIAREAKRAAQPQQFVKGDWVAWTRRGYAGLTEGVSEIHHVYDGTMTYCEQDLPRDYRHFFPPLRSLDPCMICAERRASGWEKPVEKSDTNASEMGRSVA